MSATQTSYPRDKIKILLLENISDAAVVELQRYGYDHTQRVNGSISDAVMEAAEGVHDLTIHM